MTDERKLVTGYSMAKVYKHLRNRRDLRLLEPVIKDFEARLTALEKAHEPKRRGRPPKPKGESDE